MSFSPPPFYYIDLFIPFNLIFVKEFLRELQKALSALLITRLPTLPTGRQAQAGISKKD